MIFRFTAKFQVLQCAILVLHIFQCFLPYYRSYSVCVSFSMFFSFLVIIQILQCVFRIFQLFQCLSPYFTSYSVSISFCMIFSYPPYSRFYSVHFSFSTFSSVFHSIFQVIQCFSLIFHVF